MQNTKRNSIRLGIWLCGIVWLSVATNQPMTAASPELPPDYAQSRAMREDASLHAVSFRDSSLGIAVGDRGTVLRSVDGGQNWSIVESGVFCRLHAVAWVTDRRVIAIGGAYDRVTAVSRGVVLISEDSGVRWRRGNDEELPYLRDLISKNDTGQFWTRGDFSHVDLNHVHESVDGGQNWSVANALPTQAAANLSFHSAQQRRFAESIGTSVVIRGVCRSDRTRLWAVGDHGVILQSTDAGGHWNVQRGKDRRTAVLLVASSIESVGWPLIGSEAFENRNRVAVLVHNENLSEAEHNRLGQAAVMLGSSGVDVVSSEQQAADWIAIHRPAVLVLDETLTTDTQSFYTNQAIQLGTTRVLSYKLDAAGGNMIRSGALLPKRGILISDLWQDALQLVAPERTLPSSLAWTHTYDATAGSQRRDSVTAGLSLQPGHKLASPEQPAPRRQLQIAQARMSLPHQITKWMESSRNATDWQRGLESLFGQSAKSDRFRLGWSLLQNLYAHYPAGEVRRQGLEQAILQSWSERFATTTAGKWAALRLDAIEHSAEWNHLRKSTKVLAGGQNSFSPVAKAVPVSPFQISDSAVRQASATSPIVVPEANGSIELTQPYQAADRVDLAWEFHPAVLIAREAARQRGDDQAGLQQADSQSANLQRLRTAGHVEAWSPLLQPNHPNSIIAYRTARPPRLDGKLDDSCWTSTLPRTQPGIALKMAYDDDYVYFGLRVPATQFRPDESSIDADTIRDHDLFAADRLEIRLDTDMDLLTSMQLQVSRSLRTSDSIDGNAMWQPTWYVDTEAGNHWVNVEIAVLRRDVVELPLHRGRRWYVSTRTLSAGTPTDHPLMPHPNWWRQVEFR